jgi:hypothetical protein
MPRYNLNHQDIETLLDGLQHLILKAPSIKEHNRIVSLKNKLLNKIESSTPSQHQLLDDDSEIDVWDAFR